MNSIDKFIHDLNWGFLAWPERYGRGVWVIIGPSVNHINEIREIKDGGIIESLELGFYLSDEGSWLPAAFDSSFESAIAQLEEKISPVIYNEEWRKSVYNAFECIVKESDGNNGLTSNGLTSAINNPNLFNKKEV